MPVTTQDEIREDIQRLTIRVFTHSRFDEFETVVASRVDNPKLMEACRTAIGYLHNASDDNGESYNDLVHAGRVDLYDLLDGIADEIMDHFIIGNDDFDADDARNVFRQVWRGLESNGGQRPVADPAPATTPALTMVQQLRLLVSLLAERRDDVAEIIDEIISGGNPLNDSVGSRFTSRRISLNNGASIEVLYDSLSGTMDHRFIETVGGVEVFGEWVSGLSEVHEYPDDSMPKTMAEAYRVDPSLIDSAEPRLGFENADYDDDDDDDEDL